MITIMADGKHVALEDVAADAVDVRGGWSAAPAPRPGAQGVCIQRHRAEQDVEAVDAVAVGESDQPDFHRVARVDDVIDDKGGASRGVQFPVTYSGCNRSEGWRS